MENVTLTAGMKIKVMNHKRKGNPMEKAVINFADDFVVIFTKAGKKITETRGGFIASLNCGFAAIK